MTVLDDEREARNTLPKDGIPRITKHGIELLKQGLAGDFTNWSTRYSYCNHPYSIPDEDVSNCIIMAAVGWHKDGRNQVIVQPWFGKEWPRVKPQGLVVLPDIEVSKLDYNLISENKETDSDYIKLRHEGDWYNQVIIFIEDKLVYTGNLSDDDEEDEDEDVEVVECKPRQPQQTGLEAFL